MSSLAEITRPQTIAPVNLAQQDDQLSKLADPALTRIEKTAKEFEALVLAQLLEPIFSSVEQSELTGGGPQSETFKTLLTQEYAKTIAERGGLGIADQVKASLLHLQAEQE